LGENKLIAGIQILGIVFALLMIYLTYVYYKRNNYGYKSMFMWLVVWIGVLVIISRPSTVYGIMQALEIERTADFFVMSGFTLFSIIIFYLYIVVKKSNQKVEELVRSLAIEKRKVKRSKKVKK